MVKQSKGITSLKICILIRNLKCDAWDTFNVFILLFVWYCKQTELVYSVVPQNHIIFYSHLNSPLQY